MSIQWFPGHMNSARTKAAETMETTDLVIEVLDARLPQASSNPIVHELRIHRQRPCLKILNKSDLADPAATKAWIEYFNAQKNTHAIALSCKNPAEVHKIPNICRNIAPHRNDSTKPLRMMIMGVPNVGKSTLMNALLKKRVANVGDEPAVTKTQQRLLLGKDMVLVDTPGMLWPKIAMPSDGLMLAASHAVGTNAVFEDEVAIYLADLLLVRYPALINKRFKTDDIETADGVGLIEHIAKKRGYRLKGGALDFDKAAHALLLDYRSGAIGRISLETPTSRAESLIAFQHEQAEKEAKKAQIEKERAEKANRGKRDSQQPSE